VKYCGCSAGALAAVGLVVGGEFDEAIRFCKDYCVPNAYKDIYGLFRLTEFAGKCIELSILPRMKAMPPDGMLQVATTRLPFFTSERATVHKSAEELVKTLLSSCAAFPFSPLVWREGAWYVDGGFSDFQPIVDEDTITVSPFYFSDCDIKPSRYVPLWWTLMPPTCNDTIDWIYNLGYEDCMAFIAEKGIDAAGHAADFAAVPNKKKAHPYDKPNKVSMHRFLGYNMRLISDNWAGFALDFLLLVVLVCIWKPVVLLLIYIELLLRAVMLSIVTLLQSLWDLRPIALVQQSVMKPYYLAMSYLMGIAFLQTAAEDAWRQRKSRTQRELVECLACIGSLSLLLRFISGGPSSVELRKHDKLQKQSMLYRVFRHII
jgi:hypothetical protein